MMHWCISRKFHHPPHSAIYELSTYNYPLAHSVNSLEILLAELQGWLLIQKGRGEHMMLFRVTVLHGQRP